MAKVKSVAKTKVKPTKGAKGKGNAKGAKAKDASPLAPLTNQSLSQETGAAVRLRYGPQEQAIRGQERASDQAQKNYTNWFGQYRQAVDQATQRSQQYSMDALSSIKGLADSSGQADSQSRDQMLQKLQADAATRGATVDPSIAQVSTQALASRRAGLDNHAAASLRVGTAQAQYMNDQRRIGSGREVNAHLTEQGRKRNLQQQFTQLKGQEGDYATTYKAGRVSDERKTQVAAAGLGLKNKQINASLSIAAQNNATKSSIAAGNNATTLAAARLRLTQGKALTPSQRLAIKRDHAQQRNHTGPYAPAKQPKGSKPSGSKGPTRTQRVHYRTLYDKGVSYISGGGVKKGTGRGQTINILVTHFSMPRDLAVASFEASRFGQVSLGTHNRILHRYGINLPTTGVGAGTH